MSSTQEDEIESRIIFNESDQAITKVKETHHLIFYDGIYFLLNIQFIIIFQILMEPVFFPPSPIQYPNLTYFDFAALPQAFYKYLHRLLAQNKLDTIKHIFSSFLMTLLELSNHIHYQIQFLKQIPQLNTPTTIENITASPLTYQLYLFLKQIMLKMPVGEVPLSEQSLQLSYHPKIFYYNLILDQIIKEKQKIVLSTPKTNQFEYMNYKTSLAYFQSLKGYYSGQQILVKIKKGQKIQGQELKFAIESYQNNSYHFISSQGYQKYRRNFQELLNKLKYVLRSEGVQDIENEEVSQTIEVSLLNKKNQKGEQRDGDSISEFYFICESLQEKQDFINRYFMTQIIKERQFGKQMLNRMEFMLLYHLNQLEEIETKVNTYMYLLGLKVLRSHNTQILEQFESIFNIARPSLQSAVCLSYCLFSVPFGHKMTHTMEGLLKAYSKQQNMCEQNNNKYYLQLVVLVFLIFRSKLKMTNRKQLVEKILAIPQIIENMNNVSIIDFMIGVLFCGKQLEFKIGLEPNQISQIISLEAYEAEVRKYFSEIYTNEATIFQLPEQLYTMLKLLVARRSQIVNNNKSKFLQLLFHFFSLSQQKNDRNSPTQMTSASLKKAILLMSQMNTEISQDFLNPPSMKQEQKSGFNNHISMAYDLLFWNFSVCGYYLQAIVCLELGEYEKLKSGKLSYASIEKAMRTYQYYFREYVDDPELFNYMKELIGCLINFDIIEILMQVCPHEKMYKLGTEWLTKNEENYQNVSEGRKQKKMQIKRSRLMKIIWRRFIENEKQL